MLAMGLCLVFGPRFGALSSPSQAIYLVLLSIVTGARLADGVRPHTCHLRAASVCKLLLQRTGPSAFLASCVIRFLQQHGHGAIGWPASSGRCARPPTLQAGPCTHPAPRLLPGRAPADGGGSTSLEISLRSFLAREGSGAVPFTNAAEVALAWAMLLIRPLVMLFLLIFVMAILGHPFAELKHGAKGAPGVPQDVATMLR